MSLDTQVKAKYVSTSCDLCPSEPLRSLELQRFSLESSCIWYKFTRGGRGFGQGGRSGRDSDSRCGAANPTPWDFCWLRWSFSFSPTLSCPSLTTDDGYTRKKDKSIFDVLRERIIALNYCPHMIFYPSAKLLSSRSNVRYSWRGFLKRTI